MERFVTCLRPAAPRGEGERHLTTVPLSLGGGGGLRKRGGLQGRPGSLCTIQPCSLSQDADAILNSVGSRVTMEQFLAQMQKGTVGMVCQPCATPPEGVLAAGRFAHHALLPARWLGTGAHRLTANPHVGYHFNRR